MKLLYFAFVSMATAIGYVDGDVKKYEEKLRIYQNLTNLNETSFSSILENGLQNRELFYEYTVYYVLLNFYTT